MPICSNIIRVYLHDGILYNQNKDKLLYTWMTLTDIMLNKEAKWKEPTHLILFICGSRSKTLNLAKGTKWLSLRKLVAGENHEGLLAAEMFYILI